MSARLTRRALINAAASTAALTLACKGRVCGGPTASSGAMPTASAVRPAAALVLARALGPWRDARADALAARLAKSPAIANLDPRNVEAIAARVPDGAYAIDTLLLDGLGAAERATLVAWLEAIMHDGSVGAYLLQMPEPGTCDGDIVRYTRAPAP